MNNRPTLDTNKLIAIADPYLQNIPILRDDEPIQTFGDDVEIETKIGIEKEHDVEIILRNVSKLGILKTEKRFEWHHFFAVDDTTHDALILSNTSSEVWIKKKIDKEILHTRAHRVPVLFRHESKLNPRDKEYVSAFKEVVSRHYIGSFEKVAIDFYFWFDNLSFTATLSLASNLQEKSQLYQVEFEYNGHREKIYPPSLEDVLSVFEKIFTNNFPNFINKATVYTKIEWLKNINKASRRIF